MPNIKSAEKRMRQNEVRRARNRTAKSAMKTLMKKAEQSIEAGDKAAAEADLKKTISKIDSIARKKVVHKNEAARKKSRLMADYNKKFAKA